MPQFSTAADITFCIADGRTIFMDIAHDRYFCLPIATEQAFLADREDQPLGTNDRARLERLVPQGLLEQAGSEVGRWFPRDIRTPESDFRDWPRPARRISDAIQIFRMETSVDRQRRRGSLKDSLDEIEQINAGIGDTAADRRAESLSVGWASDWLGWLRTSEDRCLSRSLAAARVLLQRGIDISLFFGVSGRPFKAHCWVQCDEVVLTDRLENVTPFTPILQI